MEFFKEYKNKPNKEILEVMLLLKEDFDKSKEVIINLTLHIEEVEKKFNLLDGEIKKRKLDG
jgi:vacuolar-type H+-ATPase subunit D/Vma8|tara:strand:- start:3309 stop:3494 length:186 start_codon:yes stop_codon:yes gene_type:complete